MTPRPLGSLPSGETVEAHTLANDAGASIKILTPGGSSPRFACPTGSLAWPTSSLDSTTVRPIDPDQK
jgi:hypothetical protein